MPASLGHVLTLMLPRGSKPSSSVTICNMVLCTSLSEPVSSPCTRTATPTGQICPVLSQRYCAACPLLSVMIMMTTK